MSAAGGAPTANRRDFLRGSAAAGAVILLGARPDGAAAEPPPETTTIRIGHSPSLCAAPQFMAEELLRAEGSYSLRLREAGMVKASPQKLIADGTDWRFLKELKRELKT